MTAESGQSMHFEIHTDGGALGNPGPGGFGFVILDAEMKEILWEAYGASDGKTTNNRMETLAFAYALQRTPEGSVITFCADSNYVWKGISEWWPVWEQKNLWGKKKNTDIIRPLWNMAKKRTILAGKKDIAHRPALPGDLDEFPFNKICDRLSNLGEEDSQSGKSGLSILIQNGKVVDSRAILVESLDAEGHGRTVDINGQRVKIQ